MGWNAATIGSGAHGGQDRHDPDDDNEGDSLEYPHAAGCGQGRRHQVEQGRDVKDPAEVPVQAQVVRAREESEADEEHLEHDRRREGHCQDNERIPRRRTSLLSLPRHEWSPMVPLDAGSRPRNLVL